MSDGDPSPPRIRTPEEAHTLVPELVGLADEVVVVRAELTEATRRIPPAPLAEAKGLEARLSELLDRIVALDVQLKGWAPLLVDIPVQVDGREVLFCWLEGDRSLGWYHELSHGFAGRRPLTDLSVTRPAD